MSTQPQLNPLARAALTLIRGALKPEREINGADLIFGMDVDQQMEISLFQRTTLEALRAGTATDTDATNLAVAVNVSMVLGERGIGAEYLPDVQAAQDALMRVLARAQRTGRHVADGPGLQALYRLMEIHEAQMESCTQAAMLSALQEIKLRRARGEVLKVA